MGSQPLRSLCAVVVLWYWNERRPAGVASFHLNIIILPQNVNLMRFTFLTWAYCTWNLYILNLHSWTNEKSSSTPNILIRELKPAKENAVKQQNWVLFPLTPMMLTFYIWNGQNILEVSEGSGCGLFRTFYLLRRTKFTSVCSHILSLSSDDSRLGFWLRMGNRLCQRYLEMNSFDSLVLDRTWLVLLLCTRSVPICFLVDKWASLTWWICKLILMKRQCHTITDSTSHQMWDLLWRGTFDIDLCPFQS